MSRTIKDMPYNIRRMEDPSFGRITIPTLGRGTCRCPMCGQKNAGKKNNRRHFRENHMTLEDNGLFARCSNQQARGILRTRMKRQTALMIWEQLNESDEIII